MVVCLFVLGFWQTTSLSRVHPAFCSMGIWIGTSPPTMRICIGGRKRMDEYLCRTVKFVKFYLLSFLMPFWLDCSWKGDFKSQWDFSARKIKNILNLFAEHWSQLLSCDRNVLCCCIFDAVFGQSFTSPQPRRRHQCMLMLLFTVMSVSFPNYSEGNDATARKEKIVSLSLTLVLMLRFCLYSDTCHTAASIGHSAPI